MKLFSVTPEIKGSKIHFKKSSRRKAHQPVVGTSVAAELFVDGDGDGGGGYDGSGDV